MWMIWGYDVRWIGHVLPVPAMRSQAEAVREFMTRNGFRSGVSAAEPTFDYLGMHLDWIWLQGCEARVSRIYPLDFSDHHAVWTSVIPSELAPVPFKRRDSDAHSLISV